MRDGGTPFGHGYRYDKVVHGYFAAIGVLGLHRVWPQLAGAPPRGFHLLLILLSVLGICALVEMLEYLGTKIAYLPEVGGYDNNLQDLLANFVGAVGGLVAAAQRRTVVGGLLLLLAAPLPPALVLTFPPDRPLRVSPADQGLAFENVTFRSRSDATLLRGWYLPGAGAGRTVILVHGCSMTV